MKKQSQKGSTFQAHKLRGKGQSQYQVNKHGTEGSSESWRIDMLRTHGGGPTYAELTRSLFKKKRKALGGMLNLREGGKKWKK